MEILGFVIVIALVGIPVLFALFCALWVAWFIITAIR